MEYAAQMCDVVLLEKPICKGESSRADPIATRLGQIRIWLRNYSLRYNF